MKAIIYSTDIDKNYFTCLINEHLLCFYLTKTDMKKYGDFLSPNAIIDFSVLEQTKTIDKRLCRRVSHFNSIQIRTSKGLQTLFDHKDIQKTLIESMWSYDFLLFIDIEMSMPSYYHSGTYQSEVIQVGYILTNKELNVIKQDGYYIKPSKGRLVSKRTLRFLNIEREVFLEAKEYEDFYEDLKEMMQEYKPKLVVWGQNDILALKDSYQINKKSVLTTPKHFINLAQIHKNYFNLQNDLGLFKAFETYYGKALTQSHDAYKDAYVMMEIFSEFRKLMP